jgi:hypothetical protein
VADTAIAVADSLSSVALTAVPDPGSMFAGWSAAPGTPNGQLCTGTTSPLIFSALTVTCVARFEVPGACAAPVDLVADFDGAADPFVVDQADLVNGATHATGWEPAGGNGGGFRRMTHVQPASAALTSVRVYHLFSPPAPAPRGYLPASDGPIHHIEYSEDRRMLDNPPAGTRGHFYVEQRGFRYFVDVGTYSNAAWETFQGSYTADQFTVPAGAPPLDFTSADSIRFGYIRGNSSGPSGGAGSTINHGIDNWKVRICR